MDSWSKFCQPFGRKDKYASVRRLVQKMHHFVSLTKLITTLAIYIQLLRCMLCAVHQKDQHKSTGTKAAHKIRVKLTTRVNFANILHAVSALIRLKLLVLICDIEFGINSVSICRVGYNFVGETEWCLL